MDAKSLKVLEFDKIISRLTEKAVISHSKEELSKLIPFDDINMAKKALAETDEARRITVKNGSFPLSPVADIRPLVKRSLINASLSCADLLNIAHVLRISRNFLRYIDIKDFEEEFPNLSRICSLITPVKETEQAIYNAIISEDEIDDNASAHLSTIRKKKNNLSNKVHDILDSIIRSPSYAGVLQDAIITMRSGRYVVPVKAEQKNAISGIVHDSSQSGATIFIEPAKVVETNNEIRRLTIEENEEIERILAELTSLVAESADVITDDFNALITLDCILAKARLADEMNASCPIINEERIINIKKARHPLLKSGQAVPIDIRLGDDFDTLVITGPNTGGKTVSLKTLGLFCLMAQSGLHIPANDGSYTGFFDDIFADIGDEQSIEQSLSTFSSHMINIVNIINRVNYKSLVLFDELGAGTDPTEGAALATAILKEVRNRGALVAATTHYSEIKLYALSTDGVENAACEFNVETLRPTYKLLIGALGKSNAFAIASKLGIPSNIIDNAKEMINIENVRFEDVANKIEIMGQKADKDREEAEKNRIEAERIKKDLEERSDNLKEKKDKILEQARREARNIINNAKEEIEQQIKALEKVSKSDKLSELEKARKKLKEKTSKIDSALYKSTVKTVKKQLSVGDIKPGTTVMVEAMGQKGIAEREPDKDGNVDVRVGILKVKTHISTLSLVEDNAEEKKQKSYTRIKGRSHAISIKNEIDVRGQSLDEALLNVDRYLDEALLANLNVVTIIHGKGTGILRSGIHDYLRTNRAVKSYRNGKYGEGENGVTVVEIG